MTGVLSNGNLDPARAGGSLRFDPRLAVPNQDQQTPLGPGMLHRDSHELLDQPGQDDLTRKRLRSFNDGLDIQLSDRRADRGSKAAGVRPWRRRGYRSSSCFTLPWAPQRS